MLIIWKKKRLNGTGSVKEPCGIPLEAAFQADTDDLYDWQVCCGYIWHVPYMS